MLQHRESKNTLRLFLNKKYRHLGSHVSFTSVAQPSTNAGLKQSVVGWAQPKLPKAALPATWEFIPLLYAGCCPLHSDQFQYCLQNPSTVLFRCTTPLHLSALTTSHCALFVSVKQLPSLVNLSPLVLCACSSNF